MFNPAKAELTYLISVHYGLILNHIAVGTSFTIPSVNDVPQIAHYDDYNILACAVQSSFVGNGIDLSQGQLKLYVMQLGRLGESRTEK